MSKCLLTLITSPVMEEAIVDWLLCQPTISGFTSNKANGHGSGHQMTIAEQVTGRRQQIMFWIEVEQELVEKIVLQLTKEFSGSGLHYWQTPLLASGTIK